MIDFNPSGKSVGASVARPFRKLALLGLLFFGCAAADAKVVYVNGARTSETGNGRSWTSAYKYLRDALLASAPNDEIWVAKGTYYPDDTADLLDKEIIFADREASFEISGQKIYGGFAGTETNLSERNAVTNPTILTGEIDPGFPLYSSLNVTVVLENSTLDSLIVENGLANGYASEPYLPQAVYNQGGACYVSKDKVLTLQNCIFRNNAAILSGAAIMIEAGDTSTVSNVIIQDCVFADNVIFFVEQRHPRDNAGGAIFGNVTANNSKFIENVVVSSSAESGSAKGGAIAGRVIANKCEFLENSVDSSATGTPTASGGAIFGNATLADCNFIGNVATASGGSTDASNSSGGAIHGVVSGKNCTFIRNISDSAKSYGGAIRGSVNIANFVFEENEGGTGTIDFRIDDKGREIGGGRGAGGGGAIFTENAESTLANCVFVRNTSEIRGGAIAADGTIASTGAAASVVTIADSTFVDNGVFAIWDRRQAQPGQTLMPPLFPPIYTTGSAISCMTRVRILNNIFWHTELVDGAFSLEEMISVTDGGALRNTYESYPSAPDFAKNIVDTLISPFYSSFDGIADIYVGEFAGNFIAADPLFVDVADPDGADNIWRTEDDGLRLSSGSSAISTSNTVTIRDRVVPYRNFLFTDKLDIDSDGNVTELIPADIAGYRRLQNIPSALTPFLDLGAYEFGDILDTPEISVEYPAGTILVDGTSTVDFSALASISTTFVIKNLGGSDLANLSITGDGANISDFKFTQPVTKVLASGSSTTFTVTFVPSVVGLRNAAIQIVSNDANENPFDINLTATAQLPDINVEQPTGTPLEDAVSTVDYGNVGLSATSTKTFTISNTGLGNLAISSISITGANASSFTATAPALTFLTTGQFTTFDLTYKPSATGAQTAALVIKSTDPDAESSFRINLTAKGVGSPEIQVRQPFSPEVVDGETNNFGSVKISSTYTKEFVVKNIGTATLKNIVISISGSNTFSKTELPVTKLAPGDSETFTVTFKPVALGSKTAALKITSSDVDEGQIDIDLIGNGISNSSTRKASGSLATLLAPTSSPQGAAAPAIDSSEVTFTTASDGAKYVVLTIQKTATWNSSHHAVEVSPNLVDWFSGAKHTTVLVDNEAILQVRDNTPVQAGQKRHIRLK